MRSYLYSVRPMRAGLPYGWPHSFTSLGGVYMSVKDDLASIIAGDLNKKFMGNKVAFFLDGTDTSPTDIKDFISTGSDMLDLAICNRPNGGIAVGRITEINGL